MAMLGEAGGVALADFMRCASIVFDELRLEH